MWILLALLAGLASTAYSAALKRELARADTWPTIACFQLAGGVVITVVAVLDGGLQAPSDWSVFGSSLATTLAFGLTGGYLSARALALTDLSIVGPLKVLTPVVMLFGGALLLGERPGLVGVLGVLTVSGGVYVAQVGRAGPGLLAPVRALWQDRGARLMLVVGFLFATSALMSKRGILVSSPTDWSAAEMTLSGLVALGIALARRIPATRWPRPRATLVAALFIAVLYLAQATAFGLTVAAFVIVVKRVDILLAVLVGRRVFGESKSPHRVLGATLMLAGFAVLALGS